MEVERLKQTLADREFDLKEVQMSSEQRLAHFEELRRQCTESEGSLAMAEKTISILNQDLERRHEVNQQLQRDKDKLKEEIEQLRRSTTVEPDAMYPYYIYFHSFVGRMITWIC